jgi:hypothetical protein
MTKTNKFMLFATLMIISIEIILLQNSVRKIELHQQAQDEILSQTVSNVTDTVSNVTDLIGFVGKELPIYRYSPAVRDNTITITHHGQVVSGTGYYDDGTNSGYAQKVVPICSDYGYDPYNTNKVYVVDGYGQCCQPLWELEQKVSLPGSQGVVTGYVIKYGDIHRLILESDLSPGSRAEDYRVTSSTKFFQQESATKFLPLPPATK